MRYKWLLLDIDNTLLDFTGAASIALKDALNDHNVLLTPELHKTYKSANHQTWSEFEQGDISAIQLRSLRFERFFNVASIEGIDPSEFNALFIDHLVERSQAYDGVIPLLDKLRENYTLSVITNGLKEAQRPRLKRLDMIRLFNTIVVSDEINVAKPHSGFFDYVLNDPINRFDNEQILVVGDNLHSDIIGGINAGLNTCWISHGRINDTEIKPDYVINNFLEIESILQ